MERSPWALKTTFPHPLRWVGFSFSLIIQKQEPHGTQSMGFEDNLPIHLFEVGGVCFYFKPL